MRRHTGLRLRMSGCGALRSYCRSASMENPGGKGVAVVTRLRPAMPADGGHAEPAVDVVDETQVEVRAGPSLAADA